MVGKLFLRGEDDNIVLSHTSAVVKDTPIFIAGIGALLPQCSAAAGVAVSYKRKGLVSATVANSIAVVIGSPVFYDSAADTVVLVRPASGFYLGVAVTAGTGNAGGTVGVDVLLNASATDALPAKAIAALSDGAVTLTAAQVLGGIAAMTPTTGRNVTMPSAVDLLALVPGAKVGSAIEFTLKNAAASSNALTVVASSNITNGGIAGDFTVAAATNASYWIVFTNVTSAPAAVMYRK